ncbi:hypothetical protein [Chenggangzhangella methanolivorans]|uniref:Apolipoprotein A1/A4/E domain-containing protein n=1 Tax=Chenggangzhangella methanolivorans TaxID=1437009 RepID=A0A9E6R9V6_9HYPH|nr:hypothetical protein [Chenggangzhangella methanolivorans]QZN99483.1 hypothetical protein K6K41_22660 [Chenggangzhangella methanolivorans]
MRGDALRETVEALNSDLIATFETRGASAIANLNQVADRLRLTAQRLGETMGVETTKAVELLDGSSSKLQDAVTEATSTLARTITRESKRAVSELTETQTALTGELAETLARLGEANTSLQSLLDNAGRKLGAVETDLASRVNAFEEIMADIAETTTRTGDRVGGQVASLRDVSVGVLERVSDVARQLESQTGAITRVIETLDGAQGQLAGQLEERRGALDTLSSSLGEKAKELGTVLEGFSTTIDASLALRKARPSGGRRAGGAGRRHHPVDRRRVREGPHLLGRRAAEDRRRVQGGQ